MIITTYKCDRCGHEQSGDKGKDNMFMLGVAIAEQSSFSYHYNSSGFKNFEHTAMWCRACVVAKGMTPPKKEEVVVTPSPTIEDMIREIAAEAAREATQS